MPTDAWIIAAAPEMFAITEAEAAAACEAHAQGAAGALTSRLSALAGAARADAVRALLEQMMARRIVNIEKLVEAQEALRAAVDAMAAGAVDEIAVKTQIWTAVSVYALVAMVRKRPKLEALLYTLLQVFSVTVFEKMPIRSALLPEAGQSNHATDGNQLNLFTN